MLNVVELFSGIGSQAKALERTNIAHEILATCDWDITAVIAYDLIHNGPQNCQYYENLDNEKLDELLKDKLISNDGKKQMTDKGKLHMHRDLKIRLLSAIERSNNLLDITAINGGDLPNETNVLTYSFPCQDLSLAGHWQGNEGGIDRNANNRSSLLWQVERILNERKEAGLKLPRFLVMENVKNILSAQHIKNFNMWKESLRSLGYINNVMCLDATNFGVPQTRVRAIMVSIFVDDDKELEDKIIERFGNIDEKNLHLIYEPENSFNMEDVLITDYNNPKFEAEAHESNPNVTVSRLEIYENSLHVNKDTPCVPTVTTKQDRFPNSGVVDFPEAKEGKCKFRYLTPRECFRLMGFDKEDFTVLMNNNFYNKRNHKFFTRDKLNKLAGNSICVNVLESVFRYIEDIDDFINEYKEKKGTAE